jgi:hypothetical protein
MSGKETLEQHAKELSQSVGIDSEVLQEVNRLFVILRKFHLPPDVSRVDYTDVLFITDTQYPLSAMDMFWTEVEVVRPDGSTYEGSDTIETYLGRNWRRFSYHRNSIWNQNGNPLMDHYVFMENRWTGKATR